MGYALAGSAYKENGWAVSDGIEDTLVLTSYFRDTIAKPNRTLLWGFSMGSVVTFELAERGAGLFDGYLAACAVGAGAPRAWDGAGVLAAAYATTFGWPAAWGSPSNVNDTIDFETAGGFGCQRGRATRDDERGPQRLGAAVGAELSQALGGLAATATSRGSSS